MRGPALAGVRTNAFARGGKRGFFFQSPQGAERSGREAPDKHPQPPERKGKKQFGNDPSAGSPTETLLRLHLPLNDKVKITSRGRRPREEAFDHDPRVSPDHSIGRCDGRCVQRAGT